MCRRLNNFGRLKRYLKCNYLIFILLIVVYNALLPLLRIKKIYKADAQLDNKYSRLCCKILTNINMIININIEIYFSLRKQIAQYMRQLHIIYESKNIICYINK